jgi:hypothetical protein
LILIVRLTRFITRFSIFNRNIRVTKKYVGGTFSIVYSDLQPVNILIAHGILKVINFGIKTK